MICKLAGLSSATRESLLWEYRLHTPDIRLSMEVREASQAIRAASRAMAVLTDGRSVTQRLKLEVLGLEDWPVLISESYDAFKLPQIRFRAT